MDLLSNVKLDSATLLGSIAICVVVSVAYEILKERRNALRNPPAPFRPTKTLALKDELVLSMLDEVTDEGMRPCYVITDPDLDDNPIIYSSEAFCSFTQYLKTEVEGESNRVKLCVVNFYLQLQSSIHLSRLLVLSGNLPLFSISTTIFTTVN